MTVIAKLKQRTTIIIRPFFDNKLMSYDASRDSHFIQKKFVVYGNGSIDGMIRCIPDGTGRESSIGFYQNNSLDSDTVNNYLGDRA